MILGITGGFGCGKSTAARLFANRGFHAIDSDALVRDRVLAEPEVRSALERRFGKAILHADGSVDRAGLGARVFSDTAELRWLEQLTHPRVFDFWREEMGSDPGGPWIIEVPVLFEKHLENWFDFIICVACARDQQLARLEQRGMERALAEQRISQQLPLAQKIELSDYVLLNDGSTAFLEKQVDLLIRELPARP